MGIATTTLTFDLPDNHDKSQKWVASVVSPSSSKKRSVRERINTSQRSPLSTSPRTRTVDNLRSTPRQRICSRALVSIPSQSVSSPSPNNKPSSPAAVSATTVLHAHRFRLRYEVRKQAKSHDLKDGILVRVSGLGCFLGVFAGCSAGWMDGLRILDQCEIFPTKK